MSVSLVKTLCNATHAAHCGVPMELQAKLVWCTNLHGLCKVLYFNVKDPCELHFVFAVQSYHLSRLLLHYNRLARPVHLPLSNSLLESPHFACSCKIHNKLIIPDLLNDCKIAACLCWYRRRNNNWG